MTTAEAPAKARGDLPGPALGGGPDIRVWDYWAAALAGWMLLALLCDRLGVHSGIAAPLGILYLCIALFVGWRLRRNHKALPLPGVLAVLGLCAAYHWFLYPGYLVCADNTYSMNMAIYCSRVMPVVRAGFIHAPGQAPPAVEMTAGLVSFLPALAFRLGLDDRLAATLAAAVPMTVLVLIFFALPFGQSLGRPAKLGFSLLLCFLITLWLSPHHIGFWSLVFTFWVVLRLTADARWSLRKGAVLLALGLCLSWSHLVMSAMGIAVASLLAVSIALAGRRWSALLAMAACILGFGAGFLVAGYLHVLSAGLSMASSLGIPAPAAPDHLFRFSFSGLADWTVVVYTVGPLLALVLLLYERRGIPAEVPVFFACFTVLAAAVLVVKPAGLSAAPTIAYLSARWKVLWSIRDVAAVTLLFGLIKAGLECRARLLSKQRPPWRRAAPVAAWCVAAVAVLGGFYLPVMKTKVAEALVLRERSRERSILSYRHLREIDRQVERGGGVLATERFSEVLVCQTWAVPLVFPRGHTPMNLDAFYDSEARRRDLAALYRTDDIAEISSILQKYGVRYVLLDDRYDYSESDFLRFSGADVALADPGEGWTLLRFPKALPQPGCRLVYIEPENVFPARSFPGGIETGYCGKGAVNLNVGDTLRFQLPYPQLPQKVGVRVLDVEGNSRLRVAFVPAGEQSNPVSVDLAYGDFAYKPSFLRVYATLPADAAGPVAAIDLTVESAARGSATVDQIVLVYDREPMGEAGRPGGLKSVPADRPPGPVGQASGPGT